MLDQFTKIDTDETLRETAKHGSSEYPFKYYLENILDFDFHCIDWHWHPEFEFVYIQEGECTIFIGAEKLTLSEGEAIFINSGIVHRFEATADCIIPNMLFAPTLLAGEDTLIYKKFIEPVIGAEDYIVFEHEEKANKIMRDIFDELADNKSDELRTVSRLMDLWAEIKPAPHRRENDITKSNQARLQIMMKFIHDNYARQITLEDIAQSVSISPSNALLIFQKSIMTSPVAYLIDHRLKVAAGLLRATEKKVGAIADETGFNSCEYFCRKFKQLYGVTPNEFRRTAASASTRPDP